MFYAILSTFSPFILYKFTITISFSCTPRSVTPIFFKYTAMECEILERKWQFALHAWICASSGKANVYKTCTIQRKLLMNNMESIYLIDFSKMSTRNTITYLDFQWNPSNQIESPK